MHNDPSVTVSPVLNFALLVSFERILREVSCLYVCGGKLSLGMRNSDENHFRANIGRESSEIYPIHELN